MARELFIRGDIGDTHYGVGRVFDGPNMGLWGNLTTGLLEVFNPAHWADYAIPLVELGNTGLFEADMPAVFNGERALLVFYYEQLGANPDAGDDDETVGVYELKDQWVLSLSFLLFL